MTFQIVISRTFAVVRKLQTVKSQYSINEIWGIARYLYRLRQPVGTWTAKFQCTITVQDVVGIPQTLILHFDF